MTNKKNHTKQDTREKILEASIKLLSEKGYKATTLLTIAQEAQVSEMTVVRHFQNKENILIESIKMLHFDIPKMKHFLETEAKYEVESDLKEIIFIILNTFIKNRKLISILLREKEFKDKIDTLIPEDLCDLLIEYFDVMKEKEKIHLPLNSEAITYNVISSIIGILVVRSRFENKFTTVTREEAVDTFIQIFTQGLKR
ncbi:TetR/AcrR family transcriptional regulator [Bacillus spongiae]|uniref:TetR/AcrR family transcriptional regulator n=1 Tax=Bacillus spongiae TaxID=2683610 RepID=A0ABU8HDV1_9BACI